MASQNIRNSDRSEYTEIYNIHVILEKTSPRSVLRKLVYFEEDYLSRCFKIFLYVWILPPIIK